MIKEEPYTLRVPRSQRGGEVVEPLVRDQWFVRMKPLAERALAAVADGHIKFVPERFEKIYNHWLENIRASALSWHRCSEMMLFRGTARIGMCCVRCSQHQQKMRQAAETSRSSSSGERHIHILLQGMVCVGRSSI